MHSPEQLGPPTTFQKQTFLLNLRDLYQAGIREMPLGPGQEIAIYSENRAGAMNLSITSSDVNDHGQQAVIYTELSISEDGELVKFIEPDMSERQVFVDTGMSQDVAAYQERMELEYDANRDPEIMIRQSYDADMIALADNFMAINSAELANYIRFTDDLIDRYVGTER